MTSLEFIEKLIENMQSILENTKTMLKPLKNKINDDLKKHYERDKKDVEEQIAYLQQIKTILKGWNGLKDKITFQSGEFIPHLLAIKKGHTALTYLEYKDIEKALEVRE